GNYSAVGSWSYRITAGADAKSANPLAVKPISTFTGAGQLAGKGDVVIDGHQQYNVVDIEAFANATYETPTIIRTGTGSIDIAAGRDFRLADTRAPGVVYTAGRNTVALPDPGFVLETIDDPTSPGDQIQIPVATNPTGFLQPIPVNCSFENACNPY